MSPVLSPAPPQAAPTRLGRNVAAVVVGGIVALALIFGGAQALEGPDVINRVVIDNPTQYPVEISVAGGNGDSLLTLGSVSSGERHTFASVVDQGDRWVVHATSARTDGGAFAVSRADLERTNWVITIPDSVASTLAANGATPRAGSE
jgi:molybdopterin biosynthesis enzyme